jgi:NAD(P)H-hydrate epimerase
MKEITKDILKDVYKSRSADVRKYHFGLLIVIGGSEFYSGAPALSALAAFKSGVDMVRIIAPKRAADIIASFSPILAAYPLSGSHLKKEHLTDLLFITESAKIASKGKTAVVIGGGIGRTEETQEVILEFLSQVSSPVVIEADAIYALEKKPEIISNKPFLITPNSYEFFILTKKDIYEISELEKIKMVQAEATRLKTTILLKGETDIISNGQEVALNKITSPYLTKGGSGDTLAGICGSLIARGTDLFLAAQAAAFINVRAGQLAGEKKKEGLLATDLIETIPEIINEYV